MATFVARLLELAEHLVETHPHSSAVRRRAVSTAYYAAFHALAGACADALLGEAGRAGVEYEKVYRALDHGPLRNVFAAKRGPLLTNPSLKRIGDLLVPLQDARMQADYASPRAGFLQVGDARDRVAEARDLVERLSTLSEADRLTLAVHLIFKDRTR